jgi:exopolyphosphatase/guanosine-5'-triphosphate,3'-diphosphate pyrophosphatase
MARLVLGQKGNLKKIKDALGDLEFARAQLALRLAVLIVHARIDDPAPALTVRMKTRIEITIGKQLNERYPMFAQAIEKEKETWGDVNMPVAIVVA